MNAKDTWAMAANAEVKQNAPRLWRGAFCFVDLMQAIIGHLD